MQSAEFAIGQHVEVADCRGTELATLEVDIQLHLSNISDAIMQYVSEQTHTPMGAIWLVWQSCDRVNYVVQSYNYWQLSQDEEDDNGFCFVCGEDCKERAYLVTGVLAIDDVWNMYCKYCGACDLCKRCSFPLHDGPCCVRCTDVLHMRELEEHQKRWIELTDATHMSWLQLAQQRDVKAKVDTRLLLRYLVKEWADIAADHSYIW